MWLKNLIEAELLALQMGHLPFSPNDDKFDGTVAYWVESFATSIGHIPEDCIEVDRQRIKKAFKTIRPKLSQWPTPFQVLDVMERRPPQRYLPHDPRQHEEEGGSVLSKMSQALVDLSDGNITKEEFDEIMEGFGS